MAAYWRGGVCHRSTLAAHIRLTILLLMHCGNPHSSTLSAAHHAPQVVAHIAYKTERLATGKPVAVAVPQQPVARSDFAATPLAARTCRPLRQTCEDARSDQPSFTVPPLSRRLRELSLTCDLLTCIFVYTSFTYLLNYFLNTLASLFESP